MQDQLVRATGAGGHIRAVAAVTTQLVEEARRRHQTSPTATAALGRAMTGAALLGANLKGKDIITLRIHGDGPLGGIVVDADANGHLRGYVKHPRADLELNAVGKLDVGGAVGRNGFLYVTRDLGLKEMYTGTAPLVTGEIGDDITHYLWTSEQTPSAVALGVLIETDLSVKAAGGYLLQVMPAAGEEERARIEQNLRSLGAVSAAVNAGMDAAELLARALEGLDYHLLDRQPLTFQCRCSRDRAADILVSLGQAELESMVREHGEAEMRCEFCAEVYRFNRAELEEILRDASAE